MNATLEDAPPLPAELTGAPMIAGLDVAMMAVSPYAIGDAEESPTSAPAGLTIEQRIERDAELRAFMEGERAKAEADRARAVTAARVTWDAQVLQGKLEADRRKREAELEELARKADAGDFDALEKLGKTMAGQVLRKVSSSEFAAAWVAEAEQAAAAIAGDDHELRQRLAVSNFPSVGAWTEALANAKVEQVAQARAVQAASSDSRSDAAGRQPGGTARRWNDLATAAALYAADEIDAAEYALARQWWDEGRLAPGPFGD